MLLAELFRGKEPHIPFIIGFPAAFTGMDAFLLGYPQGESLSGKYVPN
jgi:hypothetical protein